MTHHAIRAWLSCLPCRPEGGKWTKTGPCLDWALVGLLLQLLEDLLLEAFKDITIMIATGKLKAEVSEDGCTTELNYHQVEGARLQAGRSITTPQRKLEVLIEIIVLHPVRYLTSFFLRRSSLHTKWNATPVVFDMVTDRYNPATVALQFLSDVAAETAPILILVAAAFGCKSWTEFRVQFEESAKFLRCLARSAAALIERKFRDPFVHEHPTHFLQRPTTDWSWTSAWRLRMSSSTNLYAALDLTEPS